MSSLIPGLNLTDIGRAEVTIDGISQMVDVIKTHNRLAAIHATNGENVDAANDAIVAYMVELGFPTCTHFMAIAFNNGILDRKKQLEREIKNGPSGEPKVDSPASTASTASV